MQFFDSFVKEIFSNVLILSVTTRQVVIDRVALAGAPTQKGAQELQAQSKELHRLKINQLQREIPPSPLLLQLSLSLSQNVSTSPAATLSDFRIAKLHREVSFLTNNSGSHIFRSLRMTWT